MEPLYKDGEVEVTRSLLVIDGRSYAVHAISSIEVKQEPKDIGLWPAVAFMAACLLFGLALVGMLAKSMEAIGIGLVLGAILSVPAIKARGKPPRYGLWLQVSSAYSKPLLSDDLGRLSAIKAAIETAMQGASATQGERK